MVAVYPFGYHEARQRTSSDLKLPPHIHAAFLDGAYRDKGDELDLRAVGHLSPRDVAAVLERTRDRMLKHLRRHGLLQDGDSEDEGDGLAACWRAAAVDVYGAGARVRFRRVALLRRSGVVQRQAFGASQGAAPSSVAISAAISVPTFATLGA